MCVVQWTWQRRICNYRSVRTETQEVSWKQNTRTALECPVLTSLDLRSHLCAFTRSCCQATRRRSTCQLAQTGTNLAITEIIDHVGNVPGNCCLLIYGLHNGSQYRGQTCNVDCWDERRLLRREVTTIGIISWPQDDKWRQLGNENWPFARC